MQWVPQNERYKYNELSVIVATALPEETTDLLLDLLLGHSNMLAGILSKVTRLVLAQEPRIHRTDETRDIPPEPLLELVILFAHRICAMQPLEIVQRLVESSKPILDLVLLGPGANTDELRRGMAV